jgi:two-component system sensor histidine kinase KdpD
MPSDADRDRRPTPEEILARVMRQEGHHDNPPGKRGRLRIFLGFAAGVGKTYEMLNEANRRKQRGQDIVIGYVETHGRRGTEAQIGDLEIIPRKKIEYRGATFEEMDTDAIIARHPRYVVVDELAHTNVPGSTRQKRWQDVEAILNAGINVLSTMNVQHLESLNDTVHDITGVWVRETVPDEVLKDAYEVKMVDITPRALINRLERGEIYKADKVEQALTNFFREGNLNALREIALREIAQEVDEDVTAYRKDHHVQEPWATHDRIMVCITPTRSSLRLLRRGWRAAQRLHGEIVAVYVENKPVGPAQQEILRNDFALAERLKIPVVTLQGSVASELIRYARENRITQMVIGHSSHSRWHEFLYGSIVNRLTKELRTIDILIVAAPQEES